ncbi:hypothetical protein MKX72_19995 [Priestia sp. FSL R5-0597]|uniref:hypothetical protein n=1 Tax=Priestia sp. FSL R5-0597 TaxID=2921580 RepID=UPI0030FAB122
MVTFAEAKPNIYGDQYQLFITCDDEGNITSAEYGQMIVRLDPADFFFVVTKEEGDILNDNISKYKIQIDGFRPSLVLKEETPTETPTEPTN